MKKYCMIVKTESYYGITLMVDDDFDEDYDSLVLKKVLKDFPKKLCPVCNRDFTWRKKWKVEWDNVIYCSEKCRRNKVT